MWAQVSPQRGRRRDLHELRHLPGAVGPPQPDEAAEAVVADLAVQAHQGGALSLSARREGGEVNLKASQVARKASSMR